MLGFIVDFCCKPLRLVIEIDGSSHDGKEDYDLEREALISQFGLAFVRFTPTEIETKIDHVIRQIQIAIQVQSQSILDPCL